VAKRNSLPEVVDIQFNWVDDNSDDEHLEAVTGLLRGVQMGLAAWAVIITAWLLWR
jgi:hypothetical protein